MPASAFVSLVITSADCSDEARILRQMKELTCLPQIIQFFLDLDTILAGKLILKQALPAFAPAWLRLWLLRRYLYLNDN